jgi:hypothetical protein
VVEFEYPAQRKEMGEIFGGRRLQKLAKAVSWREVLAGFSPAK